MGEGLKKSDKIVSSAEPEQMETVMSDSPAFYRGAVKKSQISHTVIDTNSTRVGSPATYFF